MQILVNAMATFQSAVNVNAASIKWQTAKMYLDYVIVFPNDPKQHIHPVNHVTGLMSEPVVKLEL